MFSKWSCCGTYGLGILRPELGPSSIWYIRVGKCSTAECPLDNLVKSRSLRRWVISVRYQEYWTTPKLLNTFIDFGLKEIITMIQRLINYQNLNFIFITRVPSLTYPNYTFLLIYNDARSYYFSDWVCYYPRVKNLRFALLKYSNLIKTYGLNSKSVQPATLSITKLVNTRG